MTLRPPCRSAAVWPISCRRRTVWIGPLRGGTRVQDGQEPRRNRAELYTIDDASIRRRHDDIMGVGRLRAALKSGRLLLFARPMSSSANAPPAARYQVTLRMRDEEGAIVAPDGLLGGAERYRLLPGIDRWAVEASFASWFRTAR